jgi:hypothetical protein
MQVRLVRLSFLSVLVFSELLDSCIIPCLHILWVDQHQRQMLYRLKRLSFFEMGFITQVRLARLSFLSVLVFPELLDSCIIPCLNILWVDQHQRHMLYRLKRSSFSQNDIYHASEVSEVAIFKCASVL